MVLVWEGLGMRSSLRAILVVLSEVPRGHHTMKNHWREESTIPSFTGEKNLSGLTKVSMGTHNRVRC